MIINIQNIDIYLMSYIDNELSMAEKKEVELFIKAHPVYAKELALLKQTILDAEEVVYKDKHLLYRLNEMEASLPLAFKKQLYRQEAKVVEGFFTKSKMISITSIAAIFLLIIGYRFYTSTNDLKQPSFSQISQSPYHSSNGSQIEDTKTKQADVANHLTLQNNKASNTADTKMVATNNKVLTYNKVLKKQADVKIVNTSLAVKDIRSSKSIVMNSKNQLTSVEPIAKSDIDLNSTTTALTNKIIAEIESQNNLENTKQIPANTSSSLEEKENFETIDTDDHDRSVYIANIEIDGDKIRGFSRRINAIFKRNKIEKQK